MEDEPLNPYRAPETQIEKAVEARPHRPWLWLVRAILGILGLSLLDGWFGGEPAGTPPGRAAELSMKALGVVLLIVAFLPFGKPRAESAGELASETEEL